MWPRVFPPTDIRSPGAARARPLASLLTPASNQQRCEASERSTHAPDAYQPPLSSLQTGNICLSKLCVRVTKCSSTLTLEWPQWATLILRLHPPLQITTSLSHRSLQTDCAAIHFIKTLFSSLLFFSFCYSVRSLWGCLLFSFAHISIYFFH